MQIPKWPGHQYHERADEYMDAIYEKAEQLQESREDVEVEYSVCLDTCSHDLRLTDICIGRRPLNNLPSQWHLRCQQTAAEQANMAFVAPLRPKALRLGRVGREHASEGGQR